MVRIRKLISNIRKEEIIKITISRSTVSTLNTYKFSPNFDFTINFTKCLNSFVIGQVTPPLILVIDLFEDISKSKGVGRHFGRLCA
jgi:hypothetical protein